MYPIRQPMLPPRPPDRGGETWSGTFRITLHIGILALVSTNATRSMVKKTLAGQATQHRICHFNRLLSLMIYVILFFMGISLAFIADISSNLLLILQYTPVFSMCILGANLLLLALLERHMQWHNTHKQENLPLRLNIALEPLKLCGMVLSGFLLGLTQWQWLPFASKGSEYALIILLLLVSIQLRSSGMTLRQILLNRSGMDGEPRLAGGWLTSSITDEATAEGRAGDGFQLRLVLGIRNFDHRCLRHSVGQYIFLQRSSPRVGGDYVDPNAGAPQ